MCFSDYSTYICLNLNKKYRLKKAYYKDRYDDTHCMLSTNQKRVCLNNRNLLYF